MPSTSGPLKEPQHASDEVRSTVIVCLGRPRRLAPASAPVTADRELSILVNLPKLELNLQSAGPARVVLAMCVMYPCRAERCSQQRIDASCPVHTITHSKHDTPSTPLAQRLRREILSPQEPSTFCNKRHWFLLASSSCIFSSFWCLHP